MCLAIPGEVLDLRDQKGLRFANVRFGGINRLVCLEYVPEVKVGDYVLVHVGFAISTVDKEEAERSYRILEELGQTGELTADLIAELERR